MNSKAHFYTRLTPRPDRIIALILAGFYCTPLYSGPLPTVDQNPLVSIYGLPLPHDARLPQPGSSDFTSSINLSNTLNIDTSPYDLLFVDGETHRVNMIFDQGLDENWSLRLLLPWIEHEAGFMDRPIDDYHELLGLQEGERPTQPRDRLLFAYQHSGDELLYIDSPRSGGGDLQLIVNRQLHRSAQTAYSFSSAIKAPSGDSRELTGSDATDISFWTAAYWQIAADLDGSASVGLLFPGKGEILTHLQTDQVAFGHAGLQWHAWPETIIKIQFDWHTRFYENTGSAFLSDVLQFSFGGGWQLSPDMEFNFAVAEDIKVDASPDVNFNFSLRLSYE
jgi:hypothetical protein